MAVAPAGVEIDRPLRLGELLATAIKIYGQRAWAFIAVGGVQAGAFVAGAFLPFGLDLVVLSLAFAASFALAVRLALGDSFRVAAERTFAAAPSLLALAFVVAVPFYLGSAWLVLLLFSVGWLGLTAFAIPVAMIERPRDDAAGSRLVHALRRTLTLARIEYLHAVAVSAALVVIYLLLGVLLAVALVGFADNGRVVAVALAQLVLAPFFFIGLTVLYFEQQARAKKSTM